MLSGVDSNWNGDRGKSASTSVKDLIVRQVPMRDVPPFGIVGSGRVALHFHHYFTLLGLPVCTWSRRAPDPPPPEALASCTTVLLLIQDAAIEPFVEAWPDLRTKRLVHFSGSLVTPKAAGAHPLMTFGPDLYLLEVYRTIPFVLEAGGPAFDAILPGLPNPAFAIPAAERPYYHALCVMAGNFSTILWSKLFEEFQVRLNLPPGAAHPYLAQVAANLMRDPGRALTGPLARGDAHAIAANLAALEGDPFHAVYSAFVKVHAHRQ
jgi:2-dehydropantoate 2-reductase